MNDKIKELAKQAYDDVIENTPSFLVTKGMYEKTFAKLIIQECMRQVQEQYTPVLEDEVMMKDPHWNGYVQCGLDSHVAIREFFYGEEE
jgi:hypothetical protein